VNGYKRHRTVKKLADSNFNFRRGDLVVWEFNVREPVWYERKKEMISLFRQLLP
jgi:hypothetical protein